MGGGVHIHSCIGGLIWPKGPLTINGALAVVTTGKIQGKRAPDTLGEIV